MIGRQHGEGRVDLLAVQSDDELLDRIGGRHPLALTDPDATALLLQALTEEVDDGLAELLGELLDGADGVPDESSGGPETPTPTAESARLRRGAAWGAALAVAVGATLSVSGVAAAVTGDPLAPYRAVGGMFSSFGDGGLPATAADVAHLNKALAGTRAAIARGELSGVQARLDALRASLGGLDLTAAQRAAIERKLDRLEDSMAREAKAPAERGNGPAREPGAGTKVKPGPDGPPGDDTRDGGAGKAGHDKPAKDKGQDTKTEDGGDQPAGSEQPVGSDATGATDSGSAAESTDDGASSGQEEVTEPADPPGKQRADKAPKSSTLRQKAPGRLRR